jgi:hypothetical protein
LLWRHRCWTGGASAGPDEHGHSYWLEAHVRDIYQ